MNVKCGGIYRHKNDDAYSVILYTTDLETKGYCLFTHANSHNDICNQWKKYRKDIGPYKPDHAYWFVDTSILDDYLDGYVGEMNEEMLEEICDTCNYIAPIDIVRGRLFAACNCSNCKYAVNSINSIGPDLQYHCEKTGLQIGNDQEAKDHRCEEFRAHYEG